MKDTLELTIGNIKYRFDSKSIIRPNSDLLGGIPTVMTTLYRNDVELTNVCGTYAGDTYKPFYGCRGVAIYSASYKSKDDCGRKNELKQLDVALKNYYGENIQMIRMSYNDFYKQDLV